MAKSDNGKSQQSIMYKNISTSLKQHSTDIGFIIIDNSSVLFAVSHGISLQKSPTILNQINVCSPARRSGTDQNNLINSNNNNNNKNRIQTIQNEWRRQYIDEVSETARRLYLPSHPGRGGANNNGDETNSKKEIRKRSTCICGLVIAGAGEYKDLLKNKLDPRLRSIIISVTTTSIGGTVGLNEVLETNEKSINTTINDADAMLLSTWMTHVSAGDIYFAGLDQCERSIQQGAVKQFLVSIDFMKHMIRYECQSIISQSEEDNQRVVFLSRGESLYDVIASTSFRVRRQQPVLRWLMKYSNEFAIPIQWVVGNGPQVQSFQSGFGGIMGLLWFPTND